MRIEPVTRLKRHLNRVLAELGESKEPVLITESGKPSAYLLDVEDYEHMQNRMRILEGIVRGEQAIREGKVLSHQKAKQRLSAWMR
ncbi:MAG: type II toxin-antitoxin system Phd/YefM family antitoxin [Pontibacterium sp.]